MTIIEATTKLNEQATLVDGVPMLTLEDAIRAISQIDKPYWHTGEPTEEGWYVAILNDGHYGIIQYVVLKNWCKNDNTVAWHKIPPYEEQK